MKQTWFAIATVIVLLSGCSKRYNPANTPFAIYHPISEEDVRKLEKGSTTSKQVIQLFGEPDKNNISSFGERYVYGYLGDTLMVTFDESLVVNGFVYRPAAFTAVEGNPDNYQKKIKTKKVEKIQIYNTTRFDLVKWFGAPSKKEEGVNRTRYTFQRKNGTLVAYVLNNFEERVLGYTFTLKE